MSANFPNSGGSCRFGLNLTVSILVGVLGASVLNAQEALTPAPVKNVRLIVKTELEEIEGKEIHAGVTKFAPGARWQTLPSVERVCICLGGRLYHRGTRGAGSYPKAW